MQFKVQMPIVPVQMYNDKLNTRADTLDTQGYRLKSEGGAPSRQSGDVLGQTGWRLWLGVA